MEIDLLRGGSRIVLGSDLPDVSYFATLSHADQRPTVEIWPIALTGPVPVLPVPLLEPGPDVPLDLNVAISIVYDNSGYDYRIDYAQPPPPPSLSDDKMALEEQIRGQVMT